MRSGIELGQFLRSFLPTFTDYLPMNLYSNFDGKIITLPVLLFSLHYDKIGKIVMRPLALTF